MAKDYWMKDAFKPENKGKFSEKAKKAGMGTQEYASKVTASGSKASTTTKQEGNLAKVAKKIANKHKKG
jgi:hypothetical protein